MNILWEIGLQAIEIMTLVIGMLGMAMSLLLLLAPSTARNLSTFLNRSMDVDKKLLFLDKSIRTDELIYGHPVIVGGGLDAAEPARRRSRGPTSAARSARCGRRSSMPASCPASDASCWAASSTRTR